MGRKKSKIEKNGTYEANPADPLVSLIESIPEVKSQHDQCHQKREEIRKGPNPKTFNMADCIWQGLSPDLQNQVISQLNSFQKSKKSPSSQTPQYEGLQLAPFKLKSDKHQRQLEKFLVERMENILYPKGKEGLSVTHDHRLWHKLYRSQVGRNLIHTIASFCLEAEKKESTCHGQNKIWFNYSSTIRKENIEGLVHRDKSKEHFNRCLQAIPLICAEEEIYSQPSPCSGVEVSSTTYENACLVVRYIKGTRQVLIKLDHIDKAWNRLTSQKATGFEEVFSKNSDDFEIEKKALNLGSKEIAAAQTQDRKNLASLTEQEKEILEECARSYPSNKKVCDSYLMQEAESDKQMDEYSLRKYAMNEKIKRSLDEQNDPQNENLKQMLKEDGISEEQIEELLSQEDKVKELKERITRRYEKERGHLVEAMRKKFQEKTLRDAQEAQEKFNHLKETVQRRSQDYAHALHYANVVSAYLDLKLGDQVLGPHTQALQVELERSYFDTSDQRNPAGSAISPSPQKSYLDKLKEAHKDTTFKSHGQQQSKKYEVSGISLENLNTILNYLD